MVLRLVKIALLTGAAHLFTLVTLKLLTKTLPPETIALIGEVDSLFFLVLSIIAFGLQLASVRDIALYDNWKEIYKNSQKARTALGFIILFIAVFAFKKQPYLIFLFAPIFALSGDYALYGRSQPVKAASIAFIRVLFPSLILIISALYFKDQIFIAYITSIAFIYLITGIVVSKWIGSSYYFSFSFSDIKLYVKNISLGIVTVGPYFFGIGVIAIGSYFYSDFVIGIAYVGVKLYMIYRGVIRIINQAFVKEMINDEVGLKVDKLSLVTGVSLLASVILFPKSFISFFITTEYIQYQNFIILLAVAGLIASAFISLSNRSILKHKDKSFAYVTAFAAVISIIILIVLGFYEDAPYSIGLAVLFGEIIMVAGLIIINTDVKLYERLMFFLKLTGLTIIPLVVRLLAGDNISSFLAGIFLFIFCTYILFKNTFNFNLNN